VWAFEKNQSFKNYLKKNSKYSMHCHAAKNTGNSLTDPSRKKQYLGIQAGIEHMTVILTHRPSIFFTFEWH
jgi:hypothetical protein